MLMQGIKSVAILLGHTVAAVIGTAIISTSLWKFFRTASAEGVIRKECILNLICAAAIGLMMYRAWHSRLGAWAWVAPALWFALGALSLLPSGDCWYQLSGSDCVRSVSQFGCSIFSWSQSRSFGQLHIRS